MSRPCVEEARWGCGGCCGSLGLPCGAAAARGFGEPSPRRSTGASPPAPLLRPGLVKWWRSSSSTVSASFSRAVGSAVSEGSGGFHRKPSCATYSGVSLAGVSETHPRAGGGSFTAPPWACLLLRSSTECSVEFPGPPSLATCAEGGNHIAPPLGPRKKKYNIR